MAEVVPGSTQRARIVVSAPMMDLLDQLADKILIGDGCWEWQASTNGYGYGQIKRTPKNCLAHRVVYELLVGPIPDGLTLDHLCRNRRCVRPAHLEPVSPVENVLRGDGRSARNTRVSECPQGHPFDDANTYRYKDGRSRGCKECRRDAVRRYRQRAS